MLYMLNGQIHIPQYSREDRYTVQDLSDILGGLPETLFSPALPGYVFIQDSNKSGPVNARASADAFLFGFLPESRDDRCLRGNVLLAAQDLNSDIPRPLSVREREGFTSLFPSFRQWAAIY